MVLGDFCEVFHGEAEFAGEPYQLVSPQPTLTVKRITEKDVIYISPASKLGNGYPALFRAARHHFVYFHSHHLLLKISRFVVKIILQLLIVIAILNSIFATIRSKIALFRIYFLLRA